MGIIIAQAFSSRNPAARIRGQNEMDSCAGFRCCCLSEGFRNMNDMLERLAESDSIEHYEGTAGYLLFQTESAIFPFVKFEEQLSEINDYCLYLLTCLKAKVKEFEPFDIDKDDWDAPGSWEYHKLLSWEFLYQDINKCTLLSLLLAFFESTLNEIANWFSDEAGKSTEWKKVRNPKVSDYIDQIGKCCRMDLQHELAEELAYYDSIRRIRNQFVHNEWEQITDRYEKFVLADVINMISHVIMKIEQRALSSGLIGS